MVASGDLTLASGSLEVKSGGASVENSAANEPVIDITAHSGSFSNSVVRVESSRAASSSFDMLTAVASGSTVFTVAGDGSMTTAGSLTVQAGGVAVVGDSTITGGTTVSTAGLAVDSPTQSSPALHAHASDASFDSDVIYATTSR